MEVVEGCRERAPEASLSRGSSREDRGGYDCQLVHPPPAHIQTECSVCLQILREPCIVSCCGNKFCRECIEPVRAAGKDCPLCNGPDFSFMSEHSLGRTLLDLDVLCSSGADGCTWTGKLRDLERHLNLSYSAGDQLSGCQFVEVSCLHPGCGRLLQRRHASVHQESECGMRPHCCGHCGDYASTYEDVTRNHYSACGRYPLHCPNGCHASPIQRCHMEQHLKDECALSRVECPFLYAGCQVALPRREMSDHARDVVAHFTMLASVTHRLARENAELHSRVARIERETEERERGMSVKISQLSTASCSSHHFIQHTQSQKRTRGYGPISTTDATMSSALVSKKLEMEMRSMYFAVLPYEFRMDNFLNYTKRGPVEYSPVYYTHSYGYRFRVKVLRTEYSKLLSLDAFTSVFVEIVAGPFDEDLDWPFRGCVTIAMVNQLDDCNHYEQRVCFCSQSLKGQRERPEKGYPVTVGLRPFVYHKELRNRYTKDGHQAHYLHNGSLLFRITKIELSTL